MIKEVKIIISGSDKFSLLNERETKFVSGAENYLRLKQCSFDKCKSTKITSSTWSTVEWSSNSTPFSEKDSKLGLMMMRPFSIFRGRSAEKVKFVLKINVIWNVQTSANFYEQFYQSASSIKLSNGSVPISNYPIFKKHSSNNLGQLQEISLAHQTLSNT